MKSLTKLFATVSFAGLLLLIAGSAYSQMNWNDRWHGRGMMYGYGYGGGDWVWIIIRLIFWIAIIVGIVFLIRWMIISTKTAHGGSGDSALEILKRRYAKGEINKEEFEQKKRDIE
jgi:putative membrane protein